MRTPEEQPNWGWEEVDETLADEWSFSLLIEQERTERHLAFAALREQIARVELFGTDDSRRKSYHKGYINGGDDLRVLFCRKNEKGVGSFFRVHVNIEKKLPNEGLQLDVHTFAVSATENLIISKSDKQKRSKHEHEWSDLSNLQGWFLKREGDKLKTIGAKDFVPPLPYDDSCAGDDYIRVIDRRVNAEKLTKILSHLTKGIREEGITW